MPAPQGVVSVSIIAVDKASAGLKRFNQRLAAMAQPALKLNKSFRAFGREAGLSKINAGFSRMSESVRGVGASLTGAIGKMTALAGLVVGGGIVAGTKNLVNMAEELGQTAKLLGITTDHLQKLRFAAETSGVSMSTLDISLRKMSREAAAAAGGQLNDISKVFKTFNIDPKFDGEMKSTMQLMDQFADLIMNTAEEKDKLLIAKAIFGDDGALMVKLMGQGAAGLKKVGDDLENAGGLISKDTIDKATKFNFVLALVKRQGQSLFASFQAGLLPHLIDLAEEFKTLFSITKENDKEAAQEWGDIVGQKIKLFVEFLRGGIQDVKAFVLAVGGMGNALKLLGLFIFRGTILAIGRLGLSIVAFGRLLLTTPIGIFITALGAIVIAGIWMKSNWPLITKVVGEFWDKFKEIPFIAEVIKGATTSWGAWKDVIVFAAEAVAKLVFALQKMKFVRDVFKSLGVGLESAKTFFFGEGDALEPFKQLREATKFDIGGSAQAANEALFTPATAASNKETVNVAIKLITEGGIKVKEVDVPGNATVDEEAGAIATPG